MKESKPNNNKEENNSKKEEPKEQLVETQHSITLNGTEIAYTARAGTIILKHEEDEKKPQAKAEIFFVSYTKNDVSDPTTRPLMISFNGGPGSSSVWLHLGLLGPKRVLVEDANEQLLPPPYSLVKNDYSILDIADLVFIDPVGTGYSRAVPGEKADQFYEVKEDVKSVAEFIRIFITRYNYWTSAKYLIGESYGTTRAAALSSFLQEQYGLFMNGIFLVSSILDFKTRQGDFESLLYLPTLSATAWYHKKLAEDLQVDLEATMDEVRNFCYTDYASALLKGDSLEGEEYELIASQLAKYTGLSVDFIKKINLRLDLRFCKELLRDERRTVGRLDGRFKGIDKDSAGSNFEFDPSYLAIQGPYTATFNDYIRRDLEFETDLVYEILSNLYTKWSHKPASYAGDLNVAESLRKAMSQNTFLKVHVANGYFDLATPFFATEYTFTHLELDDSLRKNITMSYYDAGHMMYSKESCLAKLREELVKFIS
ncbi:MAG: peptidase S10 [Candidatus Heimdallarchaeota archaeon]|nr:peptidase S10 [Candidatus Heimdallarchaeota archaeon]MCK5048830.1 peptidase S10 [Candidatus Heimdallarchaeota archaeon]